MASCLRAFLTPPLHQHSQADSFPKASLKDGSLWIGILHRYPHPGLSTAVLLSPNQGWRLQSEHTQTH